MATARTRSGRARADATTSFFEALDSRKREPLLKNASGTIRFDLTRGRRMETWFVSVSGGDMTVTHRKKQADATVRADRDFFDRMVTGRLNPMAALLRGDLHVEGDLGLLMLFQRLFPGPPRRRARTGSDRAGSGR
jgi:putative sterol carrier protein